MKVSVLKVAEQKQGVEGSGKKQRVEGERWQKEGMVEEKEDFHFVPAF